jgi:hypothetical protein
MHGNDDFVVSNCLVAAARRNLQVGSKEALEAATARS